MTPRSASAMLVLAACAAEPAVIEPATPARPPLPLLTTTGVVGTTADKRSPACGRVSRFESGHWNGDRKPEWRHGRLVGCHYVEGGEPNVACWRVDIQAARYEQLPESVNVTLDGNSWLHAVPDDTQHLSYELVHDDPNGPPTGSKTGVHRHGDVTIKVPPSGDTVSLCKGRCAKFFGSAALVTKDWSLMVSYDAGWDAAKYVGVDIATGEERFTIEHVGARVNPTVQGGLLVVHDNKHSRWLEAYTTFDLRTGSKLCALGKPDHDIVARWEITPTRWLLHLVPVKSVDAPPQTAYDDELMFQDPTTCKVLGTIASPIHDERNVHGPGAPHAQLLPGDTGQFVLAYPGASVAVIDASVMKVTKVIRPPACAP